eukprot:COSAG01_NODE_1028_length_12028_cov_5.688826_14_plen_35_part_00
MKMRSAMARRQVAYLEVIKSEFVSFGTLDLSLAG